MTLELGIPAIFLSKRNITWRNPFPPQGPLGKVPLLPRYYETLRLPVPVSLNSVSFVQEYRCPLVCLLPCKHSGSSQGLQEFGLRYPRPGFFNGDNKTSQVPGEPTYQRALLLDPGGTLMQCLKHQDIAFLESDGVGSHDVSDFEAQSHGPLIPCVRFTAWITPGRATLGSGRWPLTRADWLPQGS